MDPHFSLQSKRDDIFNEVEQYAAGVTSWMDYTSPAVDWAKGASICCFNFWANIYIVFLSTQLFLM